MVSRQEVPIRERKAKSAKKNRSRRQRIDDQGHYQSEVFPGLWLDLAALQRGDVSQVLAVLQQGIASPEHAAFVARLHAGFGRSS
ncbi:MAG: hypothetical protein ACLP9L_05545 [Thermoguttaceae bacterium]